MVFALRKEYVSDADGGDDADEVSKESVCGCVAEFLYADTTEVDGKDIHCSVSSSLYARCDVALETIDAVRLKDIEHHGACSGSVKRLEECTRQGWNEVRRQRHKAEKPSYALGDVLQNATLAEERDAHEECQLIRYDGDNSGETFLCAFDECLEDWHFLDESIYEECHYG